MRAHRQHVARRTARRLAAAAGICLLLSACDQRNDSNEANAIPASDSGTAQLLLSATSKTDTFLGEPSCWVSFQIENRNTLPLAIFSAPFTARLDNGETALKTVTHAEAALSGAPLAPGAYSGSWRVNVVGAPCDQVRIRFTPGRLICAFEGARCSSIDTRQLGLAHMDALDAAWLRPAGS